MLEALLKELREVGEASPQHACEDEIELLREGTVFF